MSILTELHHHATEHLFPSMTIYDYKDNDDLLRQRGYFRLYLANFYKYSLSSIRKLEATAFMSQEEIKTAKETRTIQLVVREKHQRLQDAVTGELISNLRRQKIIDVRLDTLMDKLPELVFHSIYKYFIDRLLTVDDQVRLETLNEQAGGIGDDHTYVRFIQDLAAALTETLNADKLAGRRKVVAIDTADQIGINQQYQTDNWGFGIELADSCLKDLFQMLLVLNRQDYLDFCQHVMYKDRHDPAVQLLEEKLFGEEQVSLLRRIFGDFSLRGLFRLGKRAEKRKNQALAAEANEDLDDETQVASREEDGAAMPSDFFMDVDETTATGSDS